MTRQQERLCHRITAYDYSHMGHGRAYVSFDLFHRSFNSLWSQDVRGDPEQRHKTFLRSFIDRAFLLQSYLHSIVLEYPYTLEAKTRVYHFQLHENWFTLDANLLREALEITPIDQAHQFESPPSGDTIMDFMNEVDYPEETHFVSRMVVNNLYQPWRAILSMINQCLTGKISKFGLGPIHNIEDDLSLGNLKFVPKGEEDEVFGMEIPKELITDNIRKAPYYNAYLNEEQAHPEPQGEEVDYDLQQGITQKLPIVEGKGKGIPTDEQVAQSLLELQTPKNKDTTDHLIFHRQTPVAEEASTGPSVEP
ncbi:histone deacetylase 14 [Tanacetum coccineum]